MNKKDIQIIAETYIKEYNASLPTGELGALAQRGVEEYEDTSNTKEREELNNVDSNRIKSTNIFDIFVKLKKNDISKKLGFIDMVDFHAAADGMVATFKHKDGNDYEIYIKPIRNI